MSLALVATLIASAAGLVEPARVCSSIAAGRASHAARPALRCGRPGFSPPVTSGGRPRSLRSGAIQMGEKEGSSETLQAVGVLSGITAFCVIFFNALTSAGVDDIIAGNLLLVALAGAGAPRRQCPALGLTRARQRWIVPRNRLAPFLNPPWHRRCPLLLRRRGHSEGPRGRSGAAGGQRGGRADGGSPTAAGRQRRRLFPGV